MPEPLEFFCIVRETEGREWFDMSTINPIRSISQNIADETNHEMPYWAEGNPIKRIVKVRIEEVVE